MYQRKASANAGAFFVVYLEIVRCAPKGATVKRGSELSASCGRVSETKNGQEQGELRTNVSKATLFQPRLNLGGLSEGEHLAALGGSEPFPFRHGCAATLSPQVGIALG